MSFEEHQRRRGLYTQETPSRLASDAGSGLDKLTTYVVASYVVAYANSCSVWNGGLCTVALNLFQCTTVWTTSAKTQEAKKVKHLALQFTFSATIDIDRLI